MSKPRKPKLLCRLFGHIRYKGWYGDGLYGTVRPNGRDGMGTTHYRIVLDCDRCECEYTAARFHGQTVLRHEGIDPKLEH